MAQTRAVYSGSFDPPTNGHIDILRRTAAIFDHVYVAIGVNPAKKPLLAAEKRVELFKEAVPELSNRVEYGFFEGLLVDFCRRNDIHVIVRGLRTGSDFDYEFQMALANRSLAPDIETMFIPASPEHIFLSSSAVKEILGYGRDISPYVPACVAQALGDHE